MIQQKPPNLNENLSHIDSLKELQSEIRKVKSRLKEKEADLEERWEKLPKETAKATLGAAAPFLINNVVASKTWGLVQNAGTFFFTGDKGKSDLKNTLLKSAKQIGVIAAIKGLYRFWSKK
jgi:hypothetical protein